MPDPHVILAPIVEPVLPPVQHAAPPVALLPLVVTAAVLLICAAAAVWWWRRGVSRRVLQHIARCRDLQQGAQQLAQWQQRHWPAAPQAWQQALDRLRFGPADVAAAECLQRLCTEAAQAGRAR